MSSVWTPNTRTATTARCRFRPLPKDRLTLSKTSPRGIRTGRLRGQRGGLGTMGGFDRGFAEFHELFQKYGSGRAHSRQAVPGWLRAQQGRRFFAYLHFREPHFPTTPSRLRYALRPEGPIPRPCGERWRDHGGQTGAAAADRGGRAHLVRLYDGTSPSRTRKWRPPPCLEHEGLLDRTVRDRHGRPRRGPSASTADRHTRAALRGSITSLSSCLPAGKGRRGRGSRASSTCWTWAHDRRRVRVLGQGGSGTQFQGRSLLPVVQGAPGKAAWPRRTVWDRPATRCATSASSSSTTPARARSSSSTGRPTRPSRATSAPADPLRDEYFRQALHQWLRSWAWAGAAARAEQRR